MIRAAKFTDITALEGLIRRQHAVSKFADCEVSPKALEQFLMGMIAGQGQ